MQTEVELDWPAVKFRAMGTDCLIVMEPGSRSSMILETAWAEVLRLEAKFSRFNFTSELMQLNSRGGGMASNEMVELLEEALRLQTRTHGLFNPTLLNEMISLGYDRNFDQLTKAEVVFAPSTRNLHTTRIGSESVQHIHLDGNQVQIDKGFALDLGGIAKGWSAERIARIIGEHGMGALVDLGGDVFAMSPGPDEGLWPIAVEHRGEELCTLLLEEGAVCTSTTLKRRWRAFDGKLCHHILDPRYVRSAMTDLLAVTVLGLSGAEAEAWTKAAIVGGVHHGLGLLAALDIDALGSSNDGLLYAAGEVFAGVTATLTLKLLTGGPESGRSSANSIVPTPSLAP